MRVEVKLPAADAALLGDEEVELAVWLVRPGALVLAGAPLAELVTDKAAFELAAPVAGRVVELRVAARTRVRVADVLAVIETKKDGGA